METDTLPQIPRAAYEELMAIRESGETNMFHMENVKIIASREDMLELYSWLNEGNAQEKKRDYARGILRGFQVED